MTVNPEPASSNSAGSIPRRTFIAGGAALAGVLSAQSATAQEGGHEHHGGGQYAGLAMDAVHCVLTGEACLAHCLVLLEQGDTSMAACARVTRELSIACAALADLASFGSAYTKSMAQVTLEICEACEKECNKHLQHETCAACARSCARCIESCKEVLG